jgi:hypothetical protein
MGKASGNPIALRRNLQRSDDGRHGPPGAVIRDEHSANLFNEGGECFQLLRGWFLLPSIPSHGFPLSEKLLGGSALTVMTPGEIRVTVTNAPGKNPALRSHFPLRRILDVILPFRRKSPSGSILILRVMVLSLFVHQ